MFFFIFELNSVLGFNFLLHADVNIMTSFCISSTWLIAAVIMCEFGLQYVIVSLFNCNEPAKESNLRKAMIYSFL